MSLHRIALYRGTERLEVLVEDDEFYTAIRRITPFLADDAHTAHATTDERTVYRALLLTERNRAQQNYERAQANLDAFDVDEAVRVMEEGNAAEEKA